jgi:RNA polymerase sigma-70 factor (ECF subfamily)
MVLAHMLSTTQWTMVFRAAKEDRRSARPALGQLMETYWQPLYFFARGQGLSADDAEDATQAFLAELVDSEFLAAADPFKGRFRSYLLTHWKRFLIDRIRSENRIKRGGNCIVTSLDCADGEKAWLRASSNGSGPTDPDRVYYQEWASTIVRRALAQLRAEYESSQREGVFHALVPILTVPIGAQTYLELASKLSVSEGAAKVALHRLRQRFAQSVRNLVAETLDDPNDLEGEIRELTDFLHQAPK